MQRGFAFYIISMQSSALSTLIIETVITEVACMLLGNEARPTENNNTVFIHVFTLGDSRQHVNNTDDADVGWLTHSHKTDTKESDSTKTSAEPILRAPASHLSLINHVAHIDSETIMPPLILNTKASNESAQSL